MINKLVLFSIVTVSCFSTLFGVDENIHGRRKLERNTATLTAKLLIAKLQQAAAQYAVDPVKLYNEIKKAPTKHIYSAKSSKLLATEYAQMLSRVYRQQAGQMLADIEARLGSKKIFDQRFRQKACLLDKKNIQKNLKVIFPAIYKQARSKIYLEQRQQIIGKVYPTVAEFDKFDRQDLRQKLEKRVIQAQKFPVFEENFSFIRKSIIDPVIDNAGQQRNLQLQALQLNNFTQQFLPQEFESVIKKNIDNAISILHNSGKQAKVYSIFPSVKQAITNVAKQAALNKFSRYLLQVKLTTTEQGLIRMILNLPTANRTPQQSRALLFKELKSVTVPFAIMGYTEEAPVAKQPELEKFLNENALGAPVCKNALIKLFNLYNAKLLKQARNKVANIQLKKIFPKLADLSWTPPAAMVQTYYKTNKKPYIAKPFGLPEISAEKIEQSQLLTETVKLVKHNIDYIFANARRALAGQNKIVDDTYASVADSIPTTSEPGTFARILSSLGMGSKEKIVIDEQKIYEEFLKQVTTHWDAQRIEAVWLEKAPQPVNIKTKYRELFPEVKNYIKILTKAIIMDHADLKKIKPKPVKEVEKKELRKLSLTFDVDMIDKTVVVLMSCPVTQTNKQFSAPGDFIAYRKNEQKFTQAIVQAFTMQVEQLAVSGPVNLNVTIRVHNGRIFYKIISNLRNSLNQAAEKIKSSGLELIITDRFYKKSN